MHLNRMTIVQRLTAAFVLLALIGAAIGALGILSTSRMNERAQLTYGEDLTGLKIAARAESAVAYSGRALDKAMLATDEATRTALLAKRGPWANYHANMITSWNIAASGDVTHVYA